jgi:hypothetical protein
MRRGAREPLLPGRLYAFSADEIMELRRLLLPNRMAHHDTPAEARLRRHVNTIQKAQGKKVMD